MYQNKCLEWGGLNRGKWWTMNVNVVQPKHKDIFIQISYNISLTKHHDSFLIVPSPSKPTRYKMMEEKVIHINYTVQGQQVITEANSSDNI